MTHEDKLARMSTWGRLSYAFALTVLVTMVIGAIAMLANFNIVPWLLSGLLPAAVFVVAYVVAPKLSRRIKEH